MFTYDAFAGVRADAGVHQGAVALRNRSPTRGSTRSVSGSELWAWTLTHARDAAIILKIRQLSQ